ncbi:MAG: tRNA pseudouridine(55) synthase TruB [Ruminococcaceae bacterium]|nr:tRNA pseudouridine(55) synthase TruB [Oscillospiraceae bacterium]
MKNGIIVINKEDGISSFAVVSRARRLLGAEKAGHTGTLDPMATGVLPVLVGRAVKASEYMLTSDKHYLATLLLGITTDTEDITGDELSVSDAIPEESAVFEAIYSMLGDSEQIPPMYSALKVGGKKLCDMARRGEAVERQPRPITVHAIEARKINDREYEIDVKCSKGTYIRTLCADIGAKLGCGAVMKTLVRMEASGFTLKDAVTLGELENMTDEERCARIIPTEYIFRNERRVTLPPFFARLARCGVEIYVKKIGVSADAGERFALYDSDGFFALGETREYEDGLAIKPIKQFGEINRQSTDNSK